MMLFNFSSLLHILLLLTICLANCIEEPLKIFFFFFFWHLFCFFRIFACTFFIVLVWIFRSFLFSFLAETPCHSSVVPFWTSFLSSKICLSTGWSFDMGLWKNKIYILAQKLNYGILFQNKRGWFSFISDWEWAKTPQDAFEKILT